MINTYLLKRIVILKNNINVNKDYYKIEDIRDSIIRLEEEFATANTVLRQRIRNLSNHLKSNLEYVTLDEIEMSLNNLIEEFTIKS